MAAPTGFKFDLDKRRLVRQGEFEGIVQKAMHQLAKLVGNDLALARSADFNDRPFFPNGFCLFGLYFFDQLSEVGLFQPAFDGVYS